MADYHDIDVVDISRPLIKHIVSKILKVEFIIRQLEKRIAEPSNPAAVPMYQRTLDGAWGRLLEYEEELDQAVAESR